jgi:CheY-like chemotaxis protein
MERIQANPLRGPYDEPAPTSPGPAMTGAGPEPGGSRSESGQSGGADSLGEAGRPYSPGLGAQAQTPPRSGPPRRDQVAGAARLSKTSTTPIRARRYSAAEFLAALGHDLRNPLAAMTAAVELMKLRGGGILQRECAQIERQAGQLVRLVDDLLEAARLTHGRIVLRRKVTATASAVTRAIESPGRTIRFPSAIAPMPAEPQESGDLQHRHQMQPQRLLVIDDNRDTAETLREVLQAYGYTTQVAFDGPSGLEAAKSFRPDVALVDIGLPSMDGYEVARCIRRLPELCAIRLIAVTGYGQASDRRRSALAGFERHLVKPVDLEELRRLINR